MVRLNDNQGRQLLDLLDHYQDLRDERGVGRSTMADQIAQLIEDQLETGGDESPTLDAAPLIERIVSTLKSNLSGSIINGRTLQMLRNLVLTPSEIRAVTDQLAGMKITCSYCARELEDHDAATITTGDRSQPVKIACTACAPPTRVLCSGKKCTERVDLPHTSKGLFTPKCKHEGKVKEKKEKPAEPPADFPSLQEMMNQQLNQRIFTVPTRTMRVDPTTMRFTPTSEADAPLPTWFEPMEDIE